MALFSSSSSLTGRSEGKTDSILRADASMRGTGGWSSPGPKTGESSGVPASGMRPDGFDNIDGTVGASASRPGPNIGLSSGVLAPRTPSMSDVGVPG